MKRVCILICACLLLTACQQSPSLITPDNNGTIVAGVMQTLTAQVATPVQVDIHTAIAQTLTALSADADSQLVPTPVPATLLATAAPENTPVQANPPTSSSTVPQIMFTYVPPMGSSENLAGKVEEVNPDTYGVAVYILVHGGWWTKPTFATPVIPIASDGTWSCPYATGGDDTSASVIRAYLIPIGYTPPAMSGGSNLPSALEKNAVAEVEATR